jgi:hypothetical protein
VGHILLLFSVTEIQRRAGAEDAQADVAHRRLTALSDLTFREYGFVTIRGPNLKNLYGDNKPRRASSPALKTIL